MAGIGIVVDKLTRSIEDAKTGQRFETLVERISPEKSDEIKKTHWLFDWKWELAQPEREVYKLVAVHQPKVILGLLSIEDVGNPIHLHLIENVKQARGKGKAYLGVAGNMFAFACKKSYEFGYQGYIAFDAKTALISHYEQSIGATTLFGKRMIIRPEVAKLLVLKYFSLEF